jgi:hypothetical protein
MLKTLFRFWAATAAVMSSAQTNTAKKQTLTLQHIDSVDALQTTTDARGFLTDVPVAEQCIPAISSITTSVESQIDFFDPALLDNPKIDRRIYKKLKRIVVEGTEEQIRILSEIITTLINYSPEHRAYIELALTDDHPLFIFLIDIEKMQTSAYYKKQSSKHKVIGLAPSIDELTGASYCPSLNSLVLMYRDTTFDINLIKHELRHRALHAMHDRLRKRIGLNFSPYYPLSEAEMKKYQANIELGNQRILTELTTIFGTEQAGGTLTHKQSNYLKRLRKLLLDDNGHTFTREVDIVLTKEELDLLRKTTKYYFFSNIVAEAGKYRAHLSVRDPIAAIIFTATQNKQEVETLYKHNQHLSLAEHDAYTWESLPISAIREFFPKYLRQVNLLIEHAAKLPNRIRYQRQLQSFSEFEKYVTLEHSDNISTIDENNAEVAFYRALNFLGYRNAENEITAEQIFRALIKKGFFKAESLTELANLYAQQNKFDKTFEYYKRAETAFQQSSRSIAFTIQEWSLYGGLSLHNKDFERAERIYVHLIEIDFSAERKKTYTENLEKARENLLVLNDNNSASRPRTTSPRP